MEAFKVHLEGWSGLVWLAEFAIATREPGGTQLDLGRGLLLLGIVVVGNACHVLGVDVLGLREQIGAVEVVLFFFFIDLDTSLGARLPILVRHLRNLLRWLLLFACYDI